VQIGAWGTRWVPASSKLDAAARAHIENLQQGGPRTWKRVMTELREAHLGEQSGAAARRISGAP
jgi:hypothetical protein